MTARLVRDRRGASTLEYALLIVALLLVVAGGYRLLGRANTKTTGVATRVLQGGDGTLQSRNSEASSDADGQGSTEVTTQVPGTEIGPAIPGGNAPAPPPHHKKHHKSLWGSITSAAGNFVKGAVLGDFAHGTGWPGMLGQAVVGSIPIVGWVGDARDTVAGVVAVATGKPGGWPQLGGDLIAWVPIAGGPLKAGVKGATHIAEEGAIKGGEKAAAKGAEEGATKGGEAAAARAARKAELAEQRRDKALDEAIQEAHKKGKYDQLSPDDKAFVDENKENERLAIDPDGNGGYHVEEARVAQRAEASRALDGPVRRAAEKAESRESGADFIDGKGQLWDVKDARAGANGIAKAANGPENILVDCKNLTDAQYQRLVADTNSQLVANAGNVKFIR